MRELQSKIKWHLFSGHGVEKWENVGGRQLQFDSICSTLQTVKNAQLVGRDSDLFCPCQATVPVLTGFECGDYSQ